MLTIGYPQSRQIDPTRGIQFIARNLVYQRLTSIDASGRTTPLLLEGWIVAPDGLTWRLRLRADVRFQDGTALTTGDVKRTIDEAVADPDTRGSSACLGDIAGVAQLGDREVAVTLRRRCAYLLDDLETAVSRPAKDGKARIGTGPFTIVSTSPEEIVLEAWRGYYLGRPAIDRIVIRSFDALRTAWAEMMRGRVDFLQEVAPDTVEFLKDQRSVDLRAFFNYYAYGAVLNSARPVFKDPAVRRALNLAIDRDALIQQGLKGQGMPADIPVFQDNWARRRPPYTIPHDPEKAVALLRVARAAAIGVTTRHVDPDAPLAEFTLLVPANYAILERLALLLQRQLGEVNVKMRLTSLRPDVVNDRLAKGDFDAALLPIIGGPYAFIPYRFWHSPGETPRWNLWGYRNAEVDAALDAAREATDDERYKSAMARFEAAMSDDPPALFLAWIQVVQAVSRRFSIPQDAEGRNALFVMSRWRLRKPGTSAP